MCTDDAKDFFIRIGTEYPITIKIIQLVRPYIKYVIKNEKIKIKINKVK